MMRKTWVGIFAAGALLFLPAGGSDACTNVIITRGASSDNSNMISYAADSHALFGELYFRPAADYAPGTRLSIYDWDTNRYLGDIPQVEHTYQTVGNMNEHQVIIGETTWGGRPELQDRRGLIDYGSLIYITLQRAKSAREAIRIIVDLANKYGYFSEGETFSIADKDEAWIMDLIGKGMIIKNGENTQKGIVWVARRVPDGFICAHANQARIGRFPLNDPDNCMYAPDVISFARKKGYFDGEDEEFSFKKAYCPVDFGTVRGCDARVWSAYNILSTGWFTYRDEAQGGLIVTKDAFEWIDYVMGYNLDNDLPLFIRPAKKISVKDVADVMRDHYEGTPLDMTTDIGAGGNALPYRWRPMGFEYEGKSYVNERAIATQQTGFWFVAQARNYLPDLIGGLMWFGTDDAATSYLTPVYCGVTAVPDCFKVGNGDMLHYSAKSSFWINNRISNACYKMYNQMAPYVRERIDAFENDQMFKSCRYIDSTALVMYNGVAYDLQAKAAKAEERGKTLKIHGDPLKQVKAYITKYSLKTAADQFAAWVKLEETLLVKFIDGNVKAENPDGTFKHNEFSDVIPSGITQPGYTDKWKEAVVKDHGDVIQEIKKE